MAAVERICEANGLDPAIFRAGPERGIRVIDTARWELWLLLTGQHPHYRLTRPCRPTRSHQDGQAV